MYLWPHHQTRKNYFTYLNQLLFYSQYIIAFYSVLKENQEPTYVINACLWNLPYIGYIVLNSVL